MDQPADKIADRYQVQVSSSWHRWFAAVASMGPETLQLPGAFQSPQSIEDLTAEGPSAIWPGFMLPDTLPIIGNEYGDWLCVRAGEDGKLGELIHWYHGGGDWIPIGKSIEEAILHDVVDQFRPLRQQMLRGAAETLSPDHLNNVNARFNDPGFRRWLLEGLLGQTDLASFREVAVDAIFSNLSNGDYSAALQIMLDQDWAYEATACDLVEEALQGPVVQLGTPEKLASFGNDRRKLAEWLFDVPDVEVGMQKWNYAESICQSVLKRRDDLGWAYDICGWCHSRAARVHEAAAVYFQGRHASSFTDQAVRLGSHWFDGRFGKFSAAQLWSLREQLDADICEDPYLRTIWDAPSDQLLLQVQQYWLKLGNESFEAGDFPSAYRLYYRAGWDLGAQRLDHYREILALLVEAASRAGWAARHAIAQAHLQCLENRLAK